MSQREKAIAVAILLFALMVLGIAIGTALERHRCRQIVDTPAYRNDPACVRLHP